MRADMFKVIVERPRWASRHAPAVKLKKDKNFDRKFVGHKRHALEVAPYTKSLNENLAPLKRYLQKQRGRRWDDVFSEICEHLDTNSTVKMHVREHIEDFIVARISVDRNGNWLGQRKWGGAQLIDQWWPELYVDPFDGIIKETSLLRKKLGLPRRRSFARILSSYPQGPFSDFERLSETCCLIRRNGHWFRCELDRNPNCGEEQLRFELLERHWETHDRWKVTVIAQLSRKALKHHGLSNVQGGKS